MAQHNDLDTGHLVPAQRSLQHLRGVSLRNLAVDAALPLPDVFFTLSALPAASGGGAAAAGDAAGAEDEAPVYQSELAPHTANPTWAPIEWAPQARLPRAHASSARARRCSRGRASRCAPVYFSAPNSAGARASPPPPLWGSASAPSARWQRGAAPAGFRAQPD